MCPGKAEEYNRILASTIAEVLDFSDVVLNFLELNSTFKRDQILENADALSRGLRDLFGDSGKIIEDIIVRRVYKKLNIGAEEGEGSFSEKLNLAYRSFIEKKK